MGSYTALSELFAIRTFSKLHTKSLLYYQAELAELQEELNEVEKADRECSEAPRKDLSVHWKSLTATGSSSLIVGDQNSTQDARARLQWSLMLRIRDSLNEYDKAILRYTRVCASSSPPKSTSLKRFREWLRDPAFGKGFISGRSMPEAVWDVEKNVHYFALPSCGSEAVDGLTFQLTAVFTSLESFLKRKVQSENELHSISVSSKTKLNKATVNAMASMFPKLPIIVLFFIDRLLIRLGLVLLFTVLFAFMLVFGVGMRSDKTPAVTTAFAAIQVVFVGSTHSGLNGGGHVNS